MEPHAIGHWGLFYALGYIGVLYHIGKSAMALGKTLEAISTYWKENSLIIVMTVLSYNAVCAMWIWSDSLSFLGLNKGELSAMTIPLGYMANSIFRDATGAISKKLQERGNQEPPEPPTTDKP